jgi:hypothetical protein
LASQGTCPYGQSVHAGASLSGCARAHPSATGVSDRGEGIPDDDLPHIFERWTGIGLAGVRRILEQHGGGIAVESRVGEGTTFTRSTLMRMAPPLGLYLTALPTRLLNTRSSRMVKVGQEQVENASRRPG